MRRLVNALLLLTLAGLAPAASVRALLIDGPEWQKQTAAYKAILESSGLFQLDVVSAPSTTGAKEFQAPFDKYKLVILNFAGEGWPVNTLAALDKFVQAGGGLVVLAAGGGAFPRWPEYNQMIGLSAAPNRNQDAGPLWFYKGYNIAYDDTTSGAAGKTQQPDAPFVITIRDTEHPIAKGLPLTWMHAKDQLRGNLRGPGKNMVILATAHSDPDKGGTGRDEPQLLAVTYGRGRVFHTLLGSTPESLECAGFATVLQRGAEWAATGKVTQRVPADFPGEDKVSLRQR